MADLNLVHETSLPELVRARRKLIEEVKRVADQIGFEDFRDRSILAKELDRRGILSLSGCKWYRHGRKNPYATLNRFLESHVPELLRQRTGSSGEKS